MLEITIPGHGEIRLDHLVCDVNGTIATDGILLEGIRPKFNNLQNIFEIHLLTANTHGRQTKIDEILDLKSVNISPGNETQKKAEYIRKLGPDTVAAIGQGANDAEMLKAAKIGICVLSSEGTYVETLLAADLIVQNIFEGLEMFEKPMRIIASMRK